MNAIRIISLAVITLCGGFTAIAQTWTQTSAPTNVWSSIACSADGTKLFACGGGGIFLGRAGPVYISSDAGATWTPTGAPSNYWANIASSADGTKLVAAVGFSSMSGGLYTSADGGSNWTSNNIAPQFWRWVASSANGSNLFAITKGGQLFITTNSGATWSSQVAPNGAWCIASSADGTKLVAAPGSAPKGFICTSTNSGATWITNNSISSSWWSVASSADGKTLAAVDTPAGYIGHIYTSTNAGATWITNITMPFMSLQNVAVSADGKNMIAAAWHGSGDPEGPIFTSTNSGLTWISNSVPNVVWTGVACSADGNKLIAVTAGNDAASLGSGRILTSQSTPLPMLMLAPTNGLQLSWTIPSTNFVLQQNSNLATTNWTDVTNTPVLNLTNLQTQVTLPLPVGNSFYRLKTP